MAMNIMMQGTVLHKKEYIGDASREITHEDIPRVCRLMTVTAILTPAFELRGQATLCTVKET